MVETGIMSELDFEILEYINVHGKASIAEITKQFRKNSDTIDYRLDLLSGPLYVDLRNGSVPSPNASYLTRESEHHINEAGFSKMIPTGVYLITKSGKKALQDFRHSSKLENRRFFVRYWVPIVISVIALIKSFSPEIIYTLKAVMQLMK